MTTPDSTVHADETEVSTELAVISQDRALSVGDLTDPRNFLSTIDGGTVEEKLAISRALANPKSLSLHEGVVITLAGVIARPITYRDAGGTLVEGVGIYLIDKSGDAYLSVSAGIFSAVQQFFTVWGMTSAEWPAGITLTPHKKNIGNGRSTWSCDVDIVK